MKTLSIFAVCLSCLVMTPVRAGEPSEAATNKLFRFLDSMPQTLAGISSISSHARLNTVPNVEVFSDLKGRTTNNQVVFDRAGRSVRVRIQSLSPTGEILNNTIWISDPHHNVYQFEDHASILDPKMNPGKSFIPPYDPIGWIFSFVDEDIPETYPIVSDMASLHSAEAWKSLKQQADLQSVRGNAEGGINVTFKKRSGTVDVSFKPVPTDDDTSLMPSEVTFFNRSGQLIWSGKVTEWQMVNHVPLPKAASCITTIALEGKERSHAATWNWTGIQSAFEKCNEEQLGFDPKSAKSISNQATSGSIY